MRILKSTYFSSNINIPPPIFTAEEDDLMKFSQSSNVEISFQDSSNSLKYFDTCRTTLDQTSKTFYHWRATTECTQMKRECSSQHLL